MLSLSSLASYKLFAMAMFSEELFDVFGGKEEPDEERKKKRARHGTPTSAGDKAETKRVRLDLEDELEEDEEERTEEREKPLSAAETKGEGEQEKMEEGGDG